MDTSDAFLESICLEPDDDGLRLIYADWLEERGDADRVEFIRVQCELERRWPGNPTWPIHGKRRVLRRRERELLDEHGGRWKFTTFVSVCLAAHPGDEKASLALLHRLCEGATFRRGFVEVVALTCAAFAGGPCVRCHPSEYTNGGWSADPTCPDCHGTGRTEGVAGALFRAAPVREVRLAGLRPWNAGNHRWGWSKAAGDRQYGVEWVLPEPLFDLLPPTPAQLPQNPLRRWYHLSSDAENALSAACVTLGRRAAGLPALTPAPAAAP